MTSQTEIRKATDRTLPYLLDQPIDCINVWDYQKGVHKVRTRKDFSRAVAYWKDTETVRDMIRGGLGLPMAGSR